MKFSELTEEDIAYIAEIYLNKELPWDTRLRALSDKFNRSERTIQNWISIAKPLQIKYSTNLDFVMNKIVGDFESHKILTPELSRPIINLEFYKLFL
jgi:hypothetical protein